jgi:hypothetical protein
VAADRSATRCAVSWILLHQETGNVVLRPAGCGVLVTMTSPHRRCGTRIIPALGRGGVTALATYGQLVPISVPRGLAVGLCVAVWVLAARRWLVKGTVRDAALRVAPLVAIEVGVVAAGPELISLQATVHDRHRYRQDVRRGLSTGRHRVRPVDALLVHLVRAIVAGLDCTGTTASGRSPAMPRAIVESSCVDLTSRWAC